MVLFSGLVWSVRKSSEVKRVHEKILFLLPSVSFEKFKTVWKGGCQTVSVEAHFVSLFLVTHVAAFNFMDC